LYSARPRVLQLLPPVRVAKVCWAGTALFKLPLPLGLLPLPGRLAAAVAAMLTLPQAAPLRRAAEAT
jgi:hypothetical protein